MVQTHLVSLRLAHTGLYCKQMESGMKDLMDFLMWLAATMVAAGLVGSQLEVLVMISGEVAGVLAGVFLSLCLGSLLLLLVPVIDQYFLSWNRIHLLFLVLRSTRQSVLSAILSHALCPSPARVESSLWRTTNPTTERTR